MSFHLQPCGRNQTLIKKKLSPRLLPPQKHLGPSLPPSLRSEKKALAVQQSTPQALLQQNPTAPARAGGGGGRGGGGRGGVQQLYLGLYETEKQLAHLEKTTTYTTASNVAA